jgi:hypothetical protein
MRTLLPFLVLVAVLLPAAWRVLVELLRDRG